MMIYPKIHLFQRVGSTRNKLLLFFLLSLVFTLPNTINAQEGLHNVAIIAKEVMHTESKCYDLQIVNKEDKAIYLAGQNYRVYYDAVEALFSESSLTSYLGDGYLDLKLNQHFFDVDASGFGILPFDSNLGFINFGTDYKLTSNNATKLVPDIPFTTAQMCFDAIESVDFTWAQENLTSTYATAFVEISLYDGEKLMPGNIISYEVEENAVLTVQDEEVLSFESFPNPFRSEFRVELNSPLKKESVLRLENIFGQLIRKEQLEKGQSSITVDGNGLMPGAYLLSIKEGSSESTLKIIKID